MKANVWLNQQVGGLSERDARLLKRAHYTLMGNLAVPDAHSLNPLPWHPLRGIRPSSVHYPGIWNWDAAFHVLGVMRWDPELARDQIRIFLKCQQTSGLLPDVWFMSGDLVKGFGKPPVFPWAAMRLDQLAPDHEFVARVYEPFKRYEAFWMRKRGGATDGLFHYDSDAEEDQDRYAAAKLESGWDTSVRFDDASHELWAIDLNCYMVLLYRAMAHFARRLGKADDVMQWMEREHALAARINERLWDDDAGCYLDRKWENGPFSTVLTPASLMPLFVGIAPAGRAERMAALAADPQRLFPGMPTVSYDHARYSSPTYWRGPTWLNAAYFAAKGLRNYGYVDTADGIQNTILNWCSQNEDAIYEYYDSRSGKGGGVKHFGWSAAFIVEFIQNS